MDAKELLLGRRSVRCFAEREIDRGALDRALEIATFAPTGMGRQAPLLVSVTDAATVKKLSAMNADIMGTDMDPYYGAKAIVIAFSPPERVTYIEDATSVLVYLSLALHAEGLASCWVHRERQMFETEAGLELLEAWGIPEGYVGIGSLAVGHAEGDYPQPAPRKEDYVIRV